MELLSHLRHSIKQALKRRDPRRRGLCAVGIGSIALVGAGKQAWLLWAAGLGVAAGCGGAREHPTSRCSVDDRLRDVDIWPRRAPTGTVAGFAAIHTSGVALLLRIGRQNVVDLRR